MMKKQNNNLKLAFFWVISFICIIFLMSIRSFASDPYFPMGQNDNGFFSDSILSDIDTIYSSDTNYLFVKYDRTDAYGRKYYSVLSTPKTDGGISIFGELNNDGYRFSIYFVGSPIVTYYGVRFDPSGDHYSSGSPNFNTFQNLESSLYSSNVSYVSNFRLYTDNTDSRITVLSYGPDPVDPIDIGVAIIPPDPILPDFDNLTPPSKVPPTYNTSDYTWTTPPSFDGSSVENALGSIQNVIGWLSNNLKEEFKNLTDNLEGFFKYIGETIQYYAGIIIDTLNNFIQNFYDNMKSLIEPMVQTITDIKESLEEFFDLVVHPFDEEEFEDQIAECEFLNQIETLKDNCEEIQDIFDNAEERDYFVLYIDFENPFADSDHKIIHTQISFNWLKDYRSIYRPFLWVFALFDLFTGGMRIFGNIIGGKAK